MTTTPETDRRAAMTTVGIVEDSELAKCASALALEVEQLAPAYRPPPEATLSEILRVVLEHLHADRDGWTDAYRRLNSERANPIDRQIAYDARTHERLARGGEAAWVYERAKMLEERLAAAELEVARRGVMIAKLAARIGRQRAAWKSRVRIEAPV